MVRGYLSGAANAAWNETKNAASTLADDLENGAKNGWEALTTGTAPDVDRERRHVLEGIGGAAAVYFGGSNHAIGKSYDWAGEQVPDVQWQIGPFGNIKGENDVNDDATPNGEWLENYDVDKFTEDLYDQSDFSVEATNDFFKTAYEEAGREINRAGITDREEFVVNGIGASLYEKDPGLAYGEGFGEKLKALDNEDELEGIVEGYVEQELV